jgi:creatinine amidohydrolase/Fe(II)-dependent formamide hydrolase-like protein
MPTRRAPRPIVEKLRATLKGVLLTKRFRDRLVKLDQVPGFLGGGDLLLQQRRAREFWRKLPDSVWRAAHGENAARARGHGADPASSAQLRLFPERYRADLALSAQGDGTSLGFATGSLRAFVIDGLEVNAPIHITDRAANGVVAGDARLAHATAGKLCADYIVESSAAPVRRLQVVRQQRKARRKGMAEC